MSSELITISADPPSFPVTTKSLEETRSRCLALKVNGVADIEGFKIADRARMDVKADRCAVQNRAKELKKQIKDWQETFVDRPADHLCDELKKIETYLESQTEPVKAEKERLAAEAKAKKEKEAADKLAARVAALVACRSVKNPIEVAAMSDDEFAKTLGECQQADKVRREQEEEDQRKRDAERAELEELRKLRASQQPAVASPNPKILTPAKLEESGRKMAEWKQEAPTISTQPVAPPPQYRHDPSDLQKLLDYADYLESQRVPDVAEQFTQLRAECVAIVADAAIEIRKLVEQAEKAEAPKTAVPANAPSIDDI